jgi:serine/threonine protein kinase
LCPERCWPGDTGSGARASAAPLTSDLGIARATDSPALTATDCLVGTADYLAPDQAPDRSATPASDVYSLGLVVLEALRGQREYGGIPLEQAVAAAIRRPDIPARWVRDRVRCRRHSPTEILNSGRTPGEYGPRCPMRR